MNPNKPPMKNNQKSSPRVSALQITFISLLAVFLTLSGAPAQKRLEKKPTGANIALQSAQEEDLTSPVGLEPVEQGAWLAMAQRQRKTAIMDDPSWTATGSMNTARYDHSATLLPSGKILVAGGFGMTTAELFDPATGTWTAAGLPTARQNHTATLLPNGKVLVAGGGAGKSSFKSAVLYDPATGTWTATGSMGTGRLFHTATLLPDGKVLVAGGLNSVYLTSAEVYDPATGRWRETGSLNTGRGSHTATLLPSGKVLVAGGGSNKQLSSAELYDPATGAWTATASSPGNSDLSLCEELTFRCVCNRGHGLKTRGKPLLYFSPSPARMFHT